MADARDDLQEAQRRSDETETRSNEEPKGSILDMRLGDLGTRSDERTDSIQRRRFWQQERDRSPHRRGSESRLRFDERSQDWRGSWCPGERTQRRQELVPPGEDCRCQRCRNGRSCQYNHPTQLPHEELPVRICKYFMRGYCKLGSVCEFQHIKDRDGTEPMYQARSPDWRFDERTQRKYEIEYSRFRPEKKAKTILDSRDSFEDLEEGEIREQENLQELIQRYTGTETERAQHILQLLRMIIHSQSKIIPDSRMRDPRRCHDTKLRLERERMRIVSVDAQENLQEQIEKQRREAQYNLQEQISRGEVNGYCHLIVIIARRIMQARREAQVREQRQRDSIERQRREAQENIQQQQQQGLQEMPENGNVDAHDQQNRQELGFKRKEGDGV